LIGLDEKGAIVLREKVSRGRIVARLANTPRCLIGIEAAMATHYVARELIALGHEVFCSDRQTGQSTASDRGLRPQHGARITMFWQPPWPTSWAPHSSDIDSARRHFVFVPEPESWQHRPAAMM
jgi:hypothetical protein